MKIVLFNKDFQNSFIKKDLEKIKQINDEEYFLFIHKLLNSNLILNTEDNVDETEIEDEIFKTSLKSEENTFLFRKSLVRDSHLFITRRLLINWFFQRGRFDIVRKLTVPQGSIFFDTIGSFLYSPLSHIILLSFILLSFVFSSLIEKKYQYYVYIPLFLFPLLNLLYSFRAKKDLGYNFLLRVELFSPKISLSLISALLLIYSSDRLLLVLSAPSKIKVLVFLLVGVYMVTVAWIYHFMKNDISPNSSVIRGTVTSIRLFFASLVINTWGYCIWFWEMNVSNDLLFQSIVNNSENIMIPWFDISLYPRFIIMCSIICTFVATFINFIFEERKLS